jgi:hypothetical protein
MGTVFCCNRVSTNELKNSEMVGQMLVHEEGVGHHPTVTNEDITEHAHGMMKRQIICKLIVVLPIKSTTI